MRSAELILVNIDGKIHERLEEIALSRGIWLRDVNLPKTCLNLLTKGSSGVVLIRVGRDLEAEMTLVSQIARYFPRVRAVVLGDIAHPRLQALAWELGAAYVHFPPRGAEHLFLVLDQMLPK